MDAVAASDEGGLCGRQKRVVLASRRWGQVRRRDECRGRRGQESPVPGESTS